jgi:hypothetical protein
LLLPLLLGETIKLIFNGWLGVKQQIEEGVN